jgi:DNA-binding response OmpR family regulator
MQPDTPAHILVVDASPVHSLQLQAFFEEQGWTVACAGNAEDAFSEFQRKRPDLLVADEYLPESRGSELCRRLQSGTSRIPAVIWSTHRRREWRLPVDAGRPTHAFARVFIASRSNKKGL